MLLVLLNKKPYFLLCVIFLVEGIEQGIGYICIQCLLEMFKLKQLYD